MCVVVVRGDKGERNDLKVIAKQIICMASQVFLKFAEHLVVVVVVVLRKFWYTCMSICIL